MLPYKLFETLRLEDEALKLFEELDSHAKAQKLSTESPLADFLFLLDTNPKKCDSGIYLDDELTRILLHEVRTSKTT